MSHFTAIFLGLCLVASNAFADTRPNPPADRSNKETKRLMALGKYVRCSLSQSSLVQTKSGLSTPDEALYPRVVYFDSLTPEASSSSDFATYSLSWENEDFDFYFYMNSQVGEIRIQDKRTGYSVETDLDLSDFSKQEVFVGAATLNHKVDLMVTDPQNEDQKVEGEKYTTIEGSCQFLEGYVP